MLTIFYIHTRFTVSFREKSLWLTMVVLMLFNGVYFWIYLNLAGGVGLPEPGDAIVGRISMISLFIAMVILMTVTLIAGHVVIAVSNLEEAEADGDERDELIELRGETFSGMVLGAGTLFVATLAALDLLTTFAIAHALLAAVVVSEIISDGIQIYHYRRGV